MNREESQRIADLFGDPAREQYRRWIADYVDMPSQGLPERISELIDRPCHGPGCAGVLPEDGPSQDFCSDSCQRRWRAARSGVELDAYENPVIPDGLPEESASCGLFQVMSRDAAPWASRDYRPVPMQVLNLQTFAAEPSTARATLDAVGTEAAGRAFRVASVPQDAVVWAFDPKAARPHQLEVDAMIEVRRDRTDLHDLAYVEDEAFPLFNAAVRSKTEERKVSRWRREWRAVVRYFRGE